MKITKKQLKNQLNNYLLEKNINEYIIFYNILKSNDEINSIINKKTITKLLFKSYFKILKNNLYIYPLYYINFSNIKDIFLKYNQLKPYLNNSQIIISILKIKNIIINDINILKELSLNNPLIHFYKINFLLKNLFYPFFLFKNKKD